MKRLLTIGFLSLGVGLLSLSHCAEPTSIDGRPCPCADGFRCCAAADVCIAEGARCPVSFVASRSSIARVCSGEHGPPLNPPRTGAALGRFLARRWFVCEYDAKSVSGLVKNEGIEFTTDGRWFALEPGKTGYQRGAGDSKSGTYAVFNDRLDALVTPTDTTPGHDLHLEWNYAGPLVLYLDFESSPLRFRTTNGIVLWFVADDSDGTELIGDEGVSCELDHTLCKPGSKCVSEENQEICSRPASNLPKGAGCDNTQTRTCAPPLTCRPDTRQCG